MCESSHRLRSCRRWRQAELGRLCCSAPSVERRSGPWMPLGRFCLLQAFGAFMEVEVYGADFPFVAEGRPNQIKDLDGFRVQGEGVRVRLGRYRLGACLCSRIVMHKIRLTIQLANPSFEPTSSFFYQRVAPGPGLGLKPRRPLTPRFSMSSRQAQGSKRSTSGAGQSLARYESSCTITAHCICSCEYVKHFIQPTCEIPVCYTYIYIHTQYVCVCIHIIYIYTYIHTYT